MKPNRFVMSCHDSLGFAALYPTYSATRCYGIKVGWVECNETQQVCNEQRHDPLGFATLYPTYGATHCYGIKVGWVECNETQQVRNELP